MSYITDQLYDNWKVHRTLPAWVQREIQMEVDKTPLSGRAFFVQEEGDRLFLWKGGRWEEVRIIEPQGSYGLALSLIKRLVKR